MSPAAARKAAKPVMTRAQCVEFAARGMAVRRGQNPDAEIIVPGVPPGESGRYVAQWERLAPTVDEILTTLAELGIATFLFEEKGAQS